MVQKSSNDLEVANKPVYLYYMGTRSEPCSPSDTLDSGTGSDMENPPQRQVKVQTGKTKRFSATVRGSTADQGHSKHSESYNLDSEESETSLSCDSLNSSDLHRQLIITSSNGYHPVAAGNAGHYISDVSDEHSIEKIGFLPHSLLRDIRDRSANRLSAGESDDGASQSEVSDVYNQDYVTVPIVKTRGRSHQCEKKILPKNTGYENDKYYNFHINEYVLDQIIKDQPPKSRDDDSFAGYKDIANGTSTIRSSKGTVRGVKNRVRNGIATFLQMQQSNVKVGVRQCYSCGCCCCYRC